MGGIASPVAALRGGSVRRRGAGKVMRPPKTAQYTLRFRASLRCRAMERLSAACAMRELPPRTEWLRVVGGLAPRPGFWWLDSALVDARLGRFSFAGAEPWLVLRAYGTRLLRDVRRARHAGERAGRSTAFAAPLPALRAVLAPPLRGDAPLPLPFAGGAVVALSYELAAPARPGGELGLPELTAFGVDRLYA